MSRDPKAEQVLPTKEGNLFKQIVKFYETKQYKKGIKAADQILKKFPEHGETLAMKGLTLNCMGKKEEAYDLVRQGLKFDLRSHVCWHVYGLLYRSDRDYREAIKCYRNALRLDKDNVQILRDLSLLQIQMRDLSGFTETRQQLLMLKPNNRNNWIAFAIAQHLYKSYDLAAKILLAYEGTLDGVPMSERYEHGEMLLYKAMIQEESGALPDAIESLNKGADQIIDVSAAKEARGRLLLATEDLAGAESVYRELIEMNPDNYNYHNGLHASLGATADNELSDEQRSKLQVEYVGLAEKYPKSIGVKRIPLNFLEGDEFKVALEAYVTRYLRKGIPSLFSDLSSLYSNKSKADTIGKIFEDAASSLTSKQQLPWDSENTEDSEVMVWVLFYLAQHYNHRGASTVALEKIDAAIAHTPSMIDFYLVKAKILNEAGDPVAASLIADQGRSMDLADRYLNSEATKFFLQADQVEKAQETIALFTKDGDQGNNLHDMQCMWYEVEAGNSHFRNEFYGKALKMYKAVAEHFADIQEDQFDFHSYCLRKMTLRTYVKLLRMEEHLHGHFFYCKAAYGIVRSYIGIHDQPIAAEGGKSTASSATADSSQGSAGPKKEKGKRAGKGGGAKADSERKDEEAAKKLETVEDPLAETAKPLELLQTHALDRLETHYLAFEVYMRKNAWLLALRAVKRMRILCPKDPITHICTVRLFHGVAAQAADDSYSGGVVTKVLDAEGKVLLRGLSLKAFNEEFLNENGSMLAPTAAAAEALLLLEPETEKARAVELLLSAQVGSCQKECVAVHKLLSERFQDAEAAAKWQEKCAAKFPLSQAFK